MIATAFNGPESFAGGFWNIASSNVINLCLFLAAVAFYLRQKELLNPRFIEEIAFCGFSVSLPLLLAATNVRPSMLLGLGLLSGFCGYQLLDRSLAEMQGKRQPETVADDGPLPTASNHDPRHPAPWQPLWLSLSPERW